MKLGEVTIIILTILGVSCKQEDSIPLPDNVSIQITRADTIARTLYLSASQPFPGQSGTWTIESNHKRIGAFSNPGEHLTTFIGFPLENYLLRWTITNGETSVYTEISAFLAADWSVQEMVDFGITLTELLEYLDLSEIVSSSLFEVEALLQNGVSPADLYNEGISLTSLIQNGVEVEELLEFGISEMDIAVELVQTIEVKTLIEMGLDPITLIKSGAPAVHVLASGISINTMISSELSLFELADGGISVGTFVEAGFTIQQLRNENIIGSVSDIEGNVYDWVKIGKQLWLKDNIRSTLTDQNKEIQDLALYNDNEEYFETDGYLYNYASCYDACPEGWNVPSIDNLEMLFHNLMSNIKYTSSLTIKEISYYPNRPNNYVDGLSEESRELLSSIRSEVACWGSASNSNSNSLGFTPSGTGYIWGYRDWTYEGRCEGGGFWASNGQAVNIWLNGQEIQIRTTTGEDGDRSQRKSCRCVKE